MRIVKSEEEQAECYECEGQADLQIEFEVTEEQVPICRTCLAVLRWHMERLEDEGSR